MKKHAAQGGKNTTKLTILVKAGTAEDAVIAKANLFHQVKFVVLHSNDRKEGKTTKS